MSHRRTEIPVYVLATYALGCIAGRSIAVLWARGRVDERGVRRLASGAAELAHRLPHGVADQQHAA
ncbi:hypothetical protein [Nocardioides sp. WS12]|uniref:hypothetical protein n=1 Tax=Nocardioides sp. WS12 TaxID=2486272 RepID=UPI0015F86CA7|nr:hypothetical protein [Nocardioides sp. WS12]